MIKLAYGSIPKDCGTFTFYRNLRGGLLLHGIEVFCVSVGQAEAKVWNAAFADDHCVQLAAGLTDPKRQAQVFVEWARKEQIDLVMPINSVAMLSALPHLGPETRIVMRCANAFDHGYRITATCAGRTSRTVATTPRHVTDLTTSYRVDPGAIDLIPHGIDQSPFAAAGAKVRGTNPRISLGFLGRIEHNQKGVLYLPGIVSALSEAQVPFDLQIAGEGEHRLQLERLLQPWIASGSVRFLGRLNASQVPEFLSTQDIFLFPSRFEGFGFALVEAMMAGCVPVASRIDGITDFIIEHERTGLLCPIGEETSFAAAITRLARDREELGRLGVAAARGAKQRFTRERMAADYAGVFRRVVDDPSPLLAPRPWSEFVVDRNFRGTWRQRVPRPLRRVLRQGLALLLGAKS
jgi:hypothetical protein